MNYSLLPGECIEKEACPCYDKETKSELPAGYKFTKASDDENCHLMWYVWTNAKHSALNKYVRKTHIKEAMGLYIPISDS